MRAELTGDESSVLSALELQYTADYGVFGFTVSRNHSACNFPGRWLEPHESKGLDEGVTVSQFTPRVNRGWGGVGIGQGTKERGNEPPQRRRPVAGGPGRERRERKKRGCGCNDARD